MSFTLPNFLHWGNFNALRQEMGAPLAGSFRAKSTYKPIELPVVERLMDSGIDVKFEDIDVLKDGTLSYKNYRVLLYIRDVANYGVRKEMPRYHLAYCSVLETMRRNQRFGKYVVANRDDGLFPVNIIESVTEAKLLELNVCQVCLDHIGWKGFQMTKMSREVRGEHVRNFQLKEFFHVYPRDLLSVKPPHTSDTAPLNNYTEDWDDISARIKRQRGFVCNKCAIQLNSRHSQYMHVHHRNGLKYDNSESNLELLCIECHAEEPMHGQIKHFSQYEEFLGLKKNHSFEA